jgi:hypothetical protein
MNQTDEIAQCLSTFRLLETATMSVPETDRVTNDSLEPTGKTDLVESQLLFVRIAIGPGS